MFTDLMISSSRTASVCEDLPIHGFCLFYFQFHFFGKFYKIQIRHRTSIEQVEVPPSPPHTHTLHTTAIHAHQLVEALHWLVRFTHTLTHSSKHYTASESTLLRVCVTHTQHYMIARALLFARSVSTVSAIAMASPIIKTEALGFPFTTPDPFLFCVHHKDFYPSSPGGLMEAPIRGNTNDFTLTKVHPLTLLLIMGESHCRHHPSL